MRTRFEQVQAILHADRDPIGSGVPLDAYDSYAWPLVKLLQAAAPREEIARYLREAAAGMVFPVPEARVRIVMDRLMAVRTGDLQDDAGASAGPVNSVSMSIVTSSNTPIVEPGAGMPMPKLERFSVPCAEKPTRAAGSIG
jgi:hypothetical protein